MCHQYSCSILNIHVFHWDYKIYIVCAQLFNNDLHFYILLGYGIKLVAFRSSIFNSPMIKTVQYIFFHSTLVLQNLFSASITKVICNTKLFCSKHERVSFLTKCALTSCVLYSVYSTIIKFPTTMKTSYDTIIELVSVSIYSEN